MHCLVLSQSTSVTDGRTDGQNYDSQDNASISASRVKNNNTTQDESTPVHVVGQIGHQIRMDQIQGLLN